MVKFRNFWNLKEFLKKVHYSSYFEGLFITWKNCFERKKHNLSFFSFQRSWNGWIELRHYFVRYFFTSVFLLSFSKLIIFFSREKRKRYYSRLFPDWAVRLQKVTKNRYQFSILQKVKFPLTKISFFQNQKIRLVILLLKVLQRTPVKRLLWRRYFFSTKVQDFVVKQRITNCFWKRASRSLFENGTPLASFKYALKKRFLLST